MNSRFQSLDIMSFWWPEKGQNPKRAQIGSVWNFPVFQMEIPQNHGHRPNLKRNRSKFLHLGPSELSVPKMPLPGRRACQVSNPTNILSQSYGLGYFWSQKRGNAQNPLCHAHISNFIGIFCSCGGSNRVLKIWAKFTKSISCENATKFGAQNFNGPKKEN